MENTERAKKLAELIQDAGYGVRSYSGRGMYGKECLAVGGGDVPDPLSLFAEILDTCEPEDVEIVTEAMRDARQDSLGRGTITYWSRLPWAEESNED